MNRLEEILARWETDTLTPAELAELKQLLGTREGRAGLVDDWLLSEAIYHALRALPAKAPAQASAQAAVAPARAGARERRLFGWLVWREARITLRWPLGLAAAACLVLVGVYVYFQKASVGQFAAVGTEVTVERGGRTLRAQPGLALYPGDVLHVSATGSAAVSWAGESTRLEFAPATDLKVLNPMRGKRLWLQHGVVEAAVAPQPAWRPMTISTPQAAAKVVGTHFTLAATGAVTRLEVLDGAVRLRKTGLGTRADVREVTVRSGETATAAPNLKLAVRLLTGLSKDVWTVPTGTPLTEAPLKGKLAVDVAAAASNAVERLRGYVVAPETGDFTFWVGSRGGTKAVELWLSTDDDPRHNRRIAYYSPRQSGALTSGTGTARAAGGAQTLQPDWHRSPTQASAPQRLVAGQRYYLELWHEGADMNVIGLGWKRPGQRADTEPSMVDRTNLYPLPGASVEESAVK